MRRSRPDAAFACLKEKAGNVGRSWMEPIRAVPGRFVANDLREKFYRPLGSVQASGRMYGNSSTSRIELLPVSSITKRSMPTPSPPVGGSPTSNARM